MTRHDSHLLDQMLEDANVWLRDIADEMHGVDRQTAYHALRGTLFALRDRLTVDQAAQLASQLPTLIRGVYYEAYKPAGKPDVIRDQQQFLDRIIRELRSTGDDRRVLDAFRAVTTVLDRRISEGELHHVQDALPTQIRALWASGAVPADAG